MCNAVYYCSTACHQKDTNHVKTCHKFPSKAHHEPKFQVTTIMAHSIHDISSDELSAGIFRHLEKNKLSAVFRYRGEVDTDSAHAIHLQVLGLITELLTDLYRNRVIPKTRTNENTEMELAPTTTLTHHGDAIAVEHGMPHCRLWFRNTVYSDIFPCYNKRPFTL